MLSGRRIYKAIGDGNCAFNAFVLTFSQPSVLEALEKEAIQRRENPHDLFSEFIIAAADCLGVSKNWQAVKSELLRLRVQDAERLQHLVAPVMRHLSIKLSREDKEHIERTKEPILSAFTDFVLTQLSIEVRGTDDDVYKRHRFINEKFAQIYEKLIRENHIILKNLDVTHYNQLRRDELVITSIPLSRRSKEEIEQLEQIQEKLGEMDDMLETLLHSYQNELKNWWMHSSSGTSSGYDIFLEQSCLDGEWAGADLELFQLARYFHLNLTVERQHMTYHIHTYPHSQASVTLSHNGFHYDSTIDRKNVDATKMATKTSGTCSKKEKESISETNQNIAQYEDSILRAFKVGAYENKQKWTHWLNIQGIKKETNVPKQIKEDVKHAINLQQKEVEEFIKREEVRIHAQKTQEKADHLLAQRLQEEEEKRWRLRR